MTSEEEIKKLQDHAWSVGIKKWGDDKYGVMNFLQAEWEKSEYTRAVDYTQHNVSETARMVLDYWYSKFPRWSGRESEDFMIWLHQQYKDYMKTYASQRYGDYTVWGKQKLNPPDNRPLAPRQK